MKIKIFYILFLLTSILLAQNSYSNSSISGLVGHWDFSDPNNLTKAKVGLPLQLTGTHSAVSGPFGAAEIGVGSYYTATHGISPNGGGSQVNKYTIIMDIKIPKQHVWYALYQTYSANTNDADWFINSDGKMGVGDVGYASTNFVENQWYRIAISVSNGSRYDYYVDGKKVLTGTPGSIDGRFALGTKVLFFADQNGEDNTIDVADIKIYSRDLSDSEIQSLGGYPHDDDPNEIFPYLQSPTPSSIYVCWSSIGSSSPVVEYGETESLGDSVDATKVYFYDPNVKWYFAKLENLTPSTVYYYKVKTDSAQSKIFRFRTQPLDTDSTEHIRIAVLGDSRTYPNKYKEVNDSLISKVKSLYGNDLEKEINVLFNVGDIVTDGRVLSQYKTEYFAPTKNISPFVPHMVAIGNHERESSNFYKYMKYEDFKGPQSERYYSFRIGKVLFIGLNSNSSLRNNTQIDWLNSLLESAQADNSIEWIFAFCHHPGHSEMWPDGNTAYVQSRIIPTLLKYPKATMLTYGHAHDYERGTASNNSDLRLLLNGGGGSSLEAWGYYPNQTDYPEIQKSFDQYIYSIIDIDIKNKFCDVTTYSIGNKRKHLNNKLVDHFFWDKANQTPPNKPGIIEPKENSNIVFPFNIKASEYNGNFELMTSQFQITDNSGNYDNPVINIQRDFENYYGITSSNDPINLNLGINLSEYVITEKMLNNNKKYWVRVRYRDKNLQWSEWSDEISFTVGQGTDVKQKSKSVISEYKLYANYPNPFNPTTIIQFDIKETSIVNISIFNSIGEKVAELENGKFRAGHYQTEFDASKFSSGIFYCRLRANNFVKVQKLTFLK